MYMYIYIYIHTYICIYYLALSNRKGTQRLKAARSQFSNDTMHAYESPPISC